MPFAKNMRVPHYVRQRDKAQAITGRGRVDARRWPARGTAAGTAAARSSPSARLALHHAKRLAALAHHEGDAVAGHAHHAHVIAALVHVDLHVALALLHHEADVVFGLLALLGCAPDGDGILALVQVEIGATHALDLLLGAAAFKGHSDIAALLISARADVDGRSQSGEERLTFSKLTTHSDVT